MSRYKWEPEYDEENGWHIRKLVHMGIPNYSPETYESEDKAQEAADEFNDLEKCRHCRCVCMGDRRCIECSGKCTCEAKS